MITHGYSIPPKRRPVARVCVAFAAVLALALLGFSIRRLHAPRFRAPAPPAALSSAANPADAFGDFPADVYPSKRAAVAAAARRLTAAIASVQEEPAEVRLDASGCQNPAAYQEAVRAAFPSARCILLDPGGKEAEAGGEGGGEAGPGDADSVVHVRIMERDAGVSLGGRDLSEGGGEISLRAAGARGKSERTAGLDVRYDPRPWLDDFTAFANGHPAGAWFVARPHRPAASAAEARAAADAAAADTVADLVQSHASAPAPNRAPAATPETSRERAALVRSALREIHDGRLVADRFLQRFHRPYGDFWSEAVLLDVSPQRLAPLYREVHAAERRERFSRLGAALAAGLLLLTIVAAYAILNAVTRHYFAGPLRLGAAVAAAGVLAVAIVAVR